ncbi:hypothetical protein [Xanthomonas theicola]|uniref:Aerotolerance regulator N-terminal domain-containing protein n=1 Tax=Xanthomonas theicola TaxID=56464 RepID=A0A2S6ZCI3_9XANT|nr:hypothetical protein [Xanthomonas theicola]PPT87784.1 hypothetical protein XthCFBP4691_15035 [Xanthomonas theicola]QNH23707.1 hypothetical protein G4Q83_01490 [Xanthomonas theicola]
MTFATFPSWVVAVGAALLLALVTLLYRLRVRRTPVALAGATLWQQAVRQLPPRRLGGRWRRPLAWLLSLLLVLLLWLAAAGLRNPLADDGRRHVYYLDASAWLLGAGAFDAARAALERDVAARPAAQREVLLGDGMPSLLLAGDERTALLRARLRDSAARARPSGFPAWLASAGREGSDTLVHYYGAAPVLAAARGARPAGVQVEASFLAPPLAGNRGIVALGAAPAASGRWDAVDVLVALDAVGGPPPGRDALDVRLDGRPLPAGIRTVDDATGMLLTDVPAAGGTLQVALRQRDHFAADDAAALVLPMRRRLRVGVVGTLPPTLRDVLALDPSLQQVAPLQAQVLVVAADADADADAAAGAGVPALRLAAASGGAPAFRFTVRAATEQQALADHLGALGIDQARNTAIADELGRAVGVDVAQGAFRQVQAWQELFAADGGFAQSPAMPLFVDRSLHWLADQAPWVPYAVAGQPLQQALLLQGLGQSAAVRERALGDRVVLPAAGLHTVAGQPLQVGLFDRAITRGVAAPATPAARGGAAPAAFARGDLASAALLLALLLCCVEWRLHVRGRIP